MCKIDHRRISFLQNKVGVKAQYFVIKYSRRFETLNCIAGFHVTSLNFRLTLKTRYCSTSIRGIPEFSSEVTQ